MYHLARAAIVLYDVFENLAHLLQIGRIGGHEALGRLRITVDGRKRLVQLMRQ